MQELELEDILKNTSDLHHKKVWYVAIVWRPNTGKSTFLNTLIWEKISITSDVPQTTRNKILAIYNTEKSQIIFFDTPGIHESPKTFNEEINNQAISSLREADIVLYFIDTSRLSWKEETYIQKLLENVNSPIFQVYTKIDLKPKIEPSYTKNDFHISSQTQEWFDPLLEKITSLLPEWPILFPEDFYTKQSIYFRISEIIREKVFLYTKEELPHSIFIAVEEIEDSVTKDNKEILKIVAYVYTETESQKYIVIGKSGKLITKIGKYAREELEEIFEKKVFLALRVKTKKWWRKDEGFVKKMLR